MSGWMDGWMDVQVDSHRVTALQDKGGSGPCSRKA